MNKIMLISLLLMAVASASFTYSVDTDRSGFSSVTLSIQGNDSVMVPLPQDAGDFRIVGGSYHLENDSVAVSAGSSGFTTFSFTSSLFTLKTPSGWKIMFTAPEGSSVLVYMPSYSDIENPFPQPKSVSADSSRTLIQYDNPGLVTIYYTLTDVPTQPAQSDQSSLYILATALILAAAIIAASVILKSSNKPKPLPPSNAPGSANQPTVASQATVQGEKASSLDMTQGKKDMMETFNDNDLKIVNFLLSSSGKARRNELERNTGISKSSLAMAINRLEKRKIVEVDRTATTHFLKLSDYFLKL